MAGEARIGCSGNGQMSSWRATHHPVLLGCNGSQDVMRVPPGNVGSGPICIRIFVALVVLIGIAIVAVFDAGPFAEERICFIEEERRFAFCGQIETQGFVDDVVDTAACAGSELGELGFVLGGEGDLHGVSLSRFWLGLAAGFVVPTHPAMKPLEGWGTRDLLWC